MRTSLMRVAVIVLAIVGLSVSAAHAAPIVYPNPGFEAPDSTFAAGLGGFLVGYYTGAVGGYSVNVGASANGVDLPNIGLNNKTSFYGDRIVFGAVSPGDVLVFFIDVVDTGDRFFSDKSLNPDGVNHTWTNVYGGDSLVPAGFNLAFEDLYGGGDFNYYDHSIVVGIEQAAVPEPGGTMLLLGSGLLGLVAFRRRSA